jgi:hypothetical protein
MLFNRLRNDLRVMSTLVPDSGSKIDLVPQLRLVEDLHPAPALTRNLLYVEAQRRRGRSVSELGADVGDGSACG